MTAIKIVRRGISGTMIYVRIDGNTGNFPVPVAVRGEGRNTEYCFGAQIWRKGLQKAWAAFQNRGAK